MEEITVSSASDPDFANIREEEFELHATYIVQDLAVEPGTANRAEATLPRNLILKPSQVIADVSVRVATLKYECKVWCFDVSQAVGVWSTDYIPRGTRFGPLVGETYAKDAVPNTRNRKYFWRVIFYNGPI